MKINPIGKMLKKLSPEKTALEKGDIIICKYPQVKETIVWPNLITTVDVINDVFLQIDDEVIYSVRLKKVLEARTNYWSISGSEEKFLVIRAKEKIVYEISKSGIKKIRKIKKPIP